MPHPPARLGRRSLLAGAGLVAAAPSLAGCAGLTERVATTAGRRDRLRAGLRHRHRGGVYDQLARRSRRPTAGSPSTSRRCRSRSVHRHRRRPVSGTAPDVFRVDYPTMGLYASTEQLLDVTDALDELAGDVPPASCGGQLGGRASASPSTSTPARWSSGPTCCARPGSPRCPTASRTPGRGRSSARSPTGSPTPRPTGGSPSRSTGRRSARSAG